MHLANIIRSHRAIINSEYDYIGKVPNITYCINGSCYNYYYDHYYAAVINTSPSYEDLHYTFSRIQRIEI